MRGEGQVIRDGLCGRTGAQKCWLLLLHCMGIGGVYICVIFFFFLLYHGHVTLVNQGSNLCPLQWKHRVLTPWTAREVPASVFNETPVLILGIVGRAVKMRGKFNYWDEPS